MENTVYALVSITIDLSLTLFPWADFRSTKAGIKMHTSPNAVKPQSWIAMTVYLMVAIIHKQLSLPGTLHRTLQLLSVHPFEKEPLHELFTQTEFKTPPAIKSNQLLLLDL